MRNVFTICGREVKAYFTSPIAYLLMGMFGLITGNNQYAFVMMLLFCFNCLYAVIDKVYQHLVLICLVACGSSSPAARVTSAGRGSDRA